MQELYERLVEAERQHADAEKAHGDDLHEIALRLASGKNGECVDVCKKPFGVVFSKCTKKACVFSVAADVVIRCRGCGDHSIPGRS